MSTDLLEFWLLGESVFIKLFYKFKEELIAHILKLET